MGWWPKWAPVLVSMTKKTTPSNTLSTSTRIAVTLSFTDSGYIAQPYWKEQNDLINIGKLVHPKLGESKKQAALVAALASMGITPEQYERIKLRAARPFTTDTDADDGSGEIIIPQRIFQSFLNHASMEAPKAIPSIKAKGLTFCAIKIDEGFFRTGKTQADAQTFGRFVKRESSDQRAWTESRYLICDATGTLIVDESIITSEDLHQLVSWGGRYIGIGASRPQGYGRFQVTQWT